MGQDGATRAMPDDSAADASAKGPKKITVMRVAAMRGRELTGRGVDKIYQAATADGADKSGLTALTLPVIANFAVDAAMADLLAREGELLDDMSADERAALTRALKRLLAPFEA